jgi:hypothetical protein
VTAALAAAGALSDFSALPPRGVFIILAGNLVGLALLVPAALDGHLLLFRQLWGSTGRWASNAQSSRGSS